MAPGDIDLAALERRARAAYERARWWHAVIASWPLAVLLAISLAADVGLARALPFAIVGGALAIVCMQRGGELGRAVITGWIGGSLPLVAALVACRIPHACVAGTCYAWCMPACIVAGAVAGAWVMRRALARPHGRTGHAIVGALVATLTGAMGCMALGIGGTLGMLLGLALASAPTWVLARR
jgi:hypothetical protein